MVGVTRGESPPDERDVGGLLPGASTVNVLGLRTTTKIRTTLKTTITAPDLPLIRTTTIPTTLPAHGVEHDHVQTLTRIRLELDATRITMTNTLLLTLQQKQIQHILQPEILTMMTTTPPPHQLEIPMQLVPRLQEIPIQLHLQIPTERHQLCTILMLHRLLQTQRPH